MKHLLIPFSSPGEVFQDPDPRNLSLKLNKKTFVLTCILDEDFRKSPVNKFLEFLFYFYMNIKAYKLTKL